MHSVKPREHKEALALSSDELSVNELEPVSSDHVPRRIKLQQLRRLIAYHRRSRERGGDSTRW